MARPDYWTPDPEGRKAMYKDLREVKVRGGGNYTEFMKSSRRHDKKEAILKKKMGNTQKTKCTVCGGPHNAFSKHSDKDARTAGI